MCYFGVDKDKALVKWLNERDYLLNGLPVPAAMPDGCSLRELANKFVDAKKGLIETGEFSPRTWRDYYETCARMLVTLGKTRTVASLGRPTSSDCGLDPEEPPCRRSGQRIQWVRTIFVFAFESGLIDKPAKFSPFFNKPSRKAQHAAGERIFNG